MAVRQTMPIVRCLKSLHVINKRPGFSKVFGYLKVRLRTQQEALQEVGHLFLPVSNLYFQINRISKEISTLNTKQMQTPCSYSSCTTATGLTELQQKEGVLLTSPVPHPCNANKCNYNYSSIYCFIIRSCTNSLQEVRLEEGHERVSSSKTYHRSGTT